MNDDMFREVTNIDKRFVAGLAFVGSYVVVMADVIGQLAGLHKPACYNLKINTGSITIILLHGICLITSFLIVHRLIYCICISYLLPQRSHTYGFSPVCCRT